MQIQTKRRESLFPTYIYQVDVSEYDGDMLKKVISDNIFTRTDPLTLSSHKIHQVEEMSEFCNFVLEQCTDAMENQGYFPQELEFSGMWGVEQTKHGYHRQHTHPNNWMCGVFYVDAYPGDSILFHDPRLRANQIQPKTMKYNEYNTSIVKLDAVPGRMYIFPNWLEHSVEPVTHDNKRISISWNIRIPKELGAGYGCTNG